MPSQTTVTGRVTTPDGVWATSGTVEFKLRPASTGVMYRVATLGILAPQKVIATIDATGYIKNAAATGALTLWGNAAILPANSLYDVTFYPNGLKSSTVTKLLISGTTYDLSSPVFGSNVALTSPITTVDTDPLEANIIPSVDDYFVLGSNSKRWASLYVDHIFATDITGPVNVTALPVYTIATLPTPGTPGLLVKISDGNRGIWMDNGVNWAPVNGGVYNVKDFQAIGDGTANDTAAIQAAADAANTAGGGTVFFPPGTFKVNTIINGYNGVRFVGCGKGVSTILLADNANYGFYWFGGYTIGPLELKGAMAVGDLAATLETGGGASFSAGKFIYIASSSSAYWPRFMTTVESVAGDVVTLREASPMTTLLAGVEQYDNYVVYGGTLWKNVGMSDLTIRMANSAGTLRKSFAYVSYCSNVVFSDVEIENVPTSAAGGIEVVQSMDVEINKVFVNKTVLNDGVIIYYGFHVSVSDCHFKNCRFGVGAFNSAYVVFQRNNCYGDGVTGNSYRGLKFQTVGFGTVQGNCVDSFYATGFMGDDIWGCTISGNTFASIIQATCSSGVGITEFIANQSRNNVVSNNTFYNIGGEAISVGGAFGHHLISGNIIRGVATGVAIYSPSNSVIANHIDTFSNKGILCNDPSAGYNIISGNRVIGTAGQTGIQTDGGPGYNVIIGNQCTDETSTGLLAVSLDAADLYLVTLDAKLGINTATPTCALDVTGAAAISSTLAVTGITTLTGLVKTAGGVHVGGTSDPGADNLLVDGTCEITGITTLTGLTKTVGGLHVGGTSDPGTDNLLVDGTLEVTGATVHTGLVKTVAGVHVGGTSDPGADNLLVDGTATVVGAFGCNSKAAQTAYASGGVLNAYTTGAFGLNSDANMKALYDLVVAIRAALVADGIMS